MSLASLTLTRPIGILRMVIVSYYLFGYLEQLHEMKYERDSSCCLSHN
jgi:hypothetical protein